MLERVVELLACPHCASPLVQVAGVLRCQNGHTHDVARAGYVSLLAGGSTATSADTASMVAAREAFLDAGHYRPIADALAAITAPALAGSAPVVIDVGAGTGYYLDRLLEGHPTATGIALDLSKHAVRRAVHRDPRIGGVVADAWTRLPVRSRVASLVTCVFSPRNPAEFARVLMPGGMLAVVSPAPDHLAAAIEALGLIGVESGKEERLTRSMAPHFTEADSAPVEFAMDLGTEELALLGRMGPSARHITDAEFATRSARAGRCTVTASVVLRTWTCIAHQDALPGG